MLESIYNNATPSELDVRNNKNFDYNHISPSDLDYGRNSGLRNSFPEVVIFSAIAKYNFA